FSSWENDWQQLPGPYHFDPALEAGFVPWRYYLASRTFVTDATNVYVSPRTCTSLWKFGMAATKPTKCSLTKPSTQIVYKTVRYKATIRVRVKKRVRVKGKWVVRTVVVKRTVTKTKQVPKAVTTKTTRDPEPLSARAT